MAKQTRHFDLIRFSMKPPKSGRATFAIVKDIKKPNGRRETKTLKDERVDAINRAYQAEAQDYHTCVVQIKEIIEELYNEDRKRRGIHVHNSENWKVFEEFWDKEYAFRNLTSPETAYACFKRAIKTLGNLSIYSSSREEIQNAIDSKYKGNQQREIVQRLTQILKYIGRERIKLRKQPPDFVRVSYLNEEEFKELMNIVENKAEKALMTLCFYSGLRLGEAYALESHHLSRDEKSIFVEAQLDRKGRRRHTKTRKVRTAYLFPEGVEAFHTWVDLSAEEKATVDRDEAARNVVTRYCEKAFPRNPSKHITFHALRHCYAIHMLQQGVSMSWVAQSLGNTLAVCQQYYVGFELKSETVIAIDAVVQAAKSNRS